MNKNARRDNKYNLWRFIFLLAGVMAIIICSIVNLAVSSRLTWSLIVEISLLYLYICMLTLMTSTRYRGLKTLTVASILLMPYMYLLERIINNNLILQENNWFQRFGVFICLLWLAIIWLVIGLRHILKLNNWYTAGIFLS